MENTVLAAISGERIVQSKLSAIVTEDCVVIPSFSGQPHTILSIGCISQVKVVKTSYPSLIVISAGLFLLSAAAFSSKDGAGTGAPLGVLGLIFLFTYLLSQKARVVFLAGREVTQTVNGSFADVADVVAAVELARKNLLTSSTERFPRSSFLTRVKQWLNGLASPRIRTWDLQPIGD